MAASIGNKHTYTISLVDNILKWSLFANIFSLLGGLLLGLSSWVAVKIIQPSLVLDIFSYVSCAGFVTSFIMMFVNWKKACKLLGRDNNNE